MKKECFSKSERQHFSKKSSFGPQIRYESSLCFAVRPSQLFAEVELGWKIVNFDHIFMTMHSLEFSHCFSLCKFVSCQLIFCVLQL